ncbi:hypothetical protein EG329_013696 [Mollisiaceae sp. DMI_Dod_QoI]|nr:hypothetical protein EG329_013696 [Helotiales sp. DMI_Dod_QoI]
MATGPSSTCATDGSVNDFPSLPSTLPTSSNTFTSTSFTSSLAALDADRSPAQTHASSSSSPTAGSDNTLASQRVASWLSNPIDGQPHYEHTSSSTSMPAHTRDIESQLKSFDNVMAKK